MAKPPNLLVHRSEMTPKAPAALQVLRDQLGRHVYPIHRLDCSASGCLLFATEKALAGPLSAALAAPEARKTYLAFVRGRFVQDGPVEVTTPMKDDNGLLKDAASTVWCVGRSAEPRCSLLRVEPRTGRFHQVRRHVRDLHHPVVGDTDHGDSHVNRWWRQNGGVTRLGLHCLSLSLDLPDGGRLDVTCPLFEDQAAAFARLPWWDAARAALPALDLPPMPMWSERRRGPAAMGAGTAGGDEGAGGDVDAGAAMDEGGDVDAGDLPDDDDAEALVGSEE